MATAKNLAIRLSVEEAERVKAALRDLGEAAKRMRADVEGGGASGGGEGFRKLSEQIAEARQEIAGFAAMAGKLGVVGLVAKQIFDAFVGVPKAIAAAGDEINQLTIRANIATETLTGGGQNFAEIARIAQTVSAPLEITAGLFARIGRSAEGAGIASVKEVTRATEIIQKLGVISGASTQEASAAALQLGQALSSGVLNGDELRSIMESMPLLATAIAKEFGVSVGQLRDMGAAGELIATRVLKGVIAAGGEADEKFKAMGDSLGRSFQAATTSTTLFLGQLDKTLGVSKDLMAAFRGVSGAIDGATQFLAGPSAEQRLAAAQTRLETLDATRPTGIASEGFGRNRQRAADDERRAVLLKEIADLKRDIARVDEFADAEEVTRAKAQSARLAERLTALETENRKILEKAEQRSRLSKNELEELEAREKAEKDIRAKLAGFSDADQKRMIQQAGDRAVAEQRLKAAQEDRWKAEADGVRAAEKAATDAARQAEKNAKDSARAAKDEQEARNKALESVDEQINRLNLESEAISLGSRERAVLAERLKAEAALKKGLIDIDQELYQSEIKRVELAAGQKFDNEKSARAVEKAAETAKRIAEKQAEESERPMRNLFDNLQRGTAQIFEALLSGTLKTGDALKKVLLNAAAEYISAIAITPAFRTAGAAIGLGSGQGGGAGGGFPMPSFGGGGLLDGITGRIDSFGYNTLGIGSYGASGLTNAAGNVIAGPGALGSVPDMIAGGGVSGGLTGGLSSYLPFAGVGIGALTQFAQGNVGGGAGTLGGAGIGFALGGPLGMGIGSALGGLVGGSLFGGKKPSVGPGGGISFGVGADGKVQIGGSSQDNGYDPIAANSSAAQSVADAAAKIIERMGGRLTGTVNADRGADLGYDAGVKMFTGGGDTSEGRGRFKTLEEAMAASVTSIIKNATTEGLSKDLADRLSKVNSQQDVDGLLQYIEGLKTLRDGFVNWKEPMTQAETAMAGLKASFEQAKAAAESLSSSTEEVEASFKKQQKALVEAFNDDLINRELRALGQAGAADERQRAKAEADLRKQAAALGAEAVLQVEKTLAAERAASVAATQQARIQPIVDSYTGILNSIAAGMEQGIRQWTELANSIQAFNDSLGLSALSPLSPQDRLAMAQSQYSGLLGKAMGGDATAAQSVTAAAEKLLSEGRGFYASSQGYADLYSLVRSDLGELSGFAGATMPARLQEEARMRAEMMREMMNAELRGVRGFASGGVTNPGEMVRVHPGELLYTGPQTRVFNARETTAILNGGGDKDWSRIEAKLDQLIRVTAASGRMNAETQAQMAETLDAIRRKASLVSAQ
jgi:tape measure domain-containing protein